jgi:serine/threonine protein kinase
VSAATSAGYGSLARFELLRELGRGAQARVWLAHDPRLDREVALKLMDAEADADAVNLWLHEARAVSRLSHPNVVPVFEADEHEGQPYLVFEYVEGPTLAQARRGQPPMPAKEAVELMIGVLDALAAAHEQGIVHRDLKPSNILLGSDGRARVMDFGIAGRVAPPRRAGGRRGATMVLDANEGRIMGTPGYISPEAARGAAPVPAMDVFAAGVKGSSAVAAEIATTVMRKPMLFWNASALPTISGGHARAERDENCGESATTATPQASNSASSAGAGQPCANGNARHAAADPASAPAATRAPPTARDARPPTMQPSAPAPSTTNAAHDSASPASRVASSAGTSTHIVYSSHMWPK